MANSIALAERYDAVLDEVYKEASLTDALESQNVKFDNTKTVKILKVEVPELGDYSRNSGFAIGDVNATWESWTLQEDRGREFSIDAMDNDETLDLTFGKASSEFIRTKVVPEVDRYRFAKIAGTTGISAAVPADFTTGAAVEAAIIAAETDLDDNEVPKEGRVLYITSRNYNLLKQAFATRFTSKTDVLNRSFDEFDGMRVVVVPQNRFVTKLAKKADGSYEKDSTTGLNINFLMLHPSAVEAVAKHKKLRVFTPDENQDADAYKFQYRIYHDLFVYENKVAGIYLHPATT